MIWGEKEPENPFDHISANNTNAKKYVAHENNRDYDGDSGRTERAPPQLASRVADAMMKKM